LINSGLLERVSDISHLTEAWRHVQKRDSADGNVAPSVAAFAEDPEERLAALSTELRERRYHFGPLAPVAIPKDDGEIRTLLIAPAGDRVVERALAQVLMPIVDPILSPASYAFRPGLGVGSAIRRLVELRDEGLPWVCRTDIDDCFDSIPPRRVLKVIEQCLPDRGVLDLIADCIGPHRRPPRHRTGLGIAQGGSLSPMLANLYLDAFDVRLLARGFPLVRYADDITIAVSNEKEGKMALKESELAAAALDLRLGADDTEIVSYEQGFAFLGEDFNTRYPPSSATADLHTPDRRTLYVAVPGAYILITRGRVIVTRKGVDLLSAPSGRVGRIVVGGSVGISPGLRAWALENCVDVVFLSRRGSYQGYLAGPRWPAVERRRHQFEATADPAICVQMALCFAGGKLAHQRTLLLRFNRRNTAKEVAESIGEISRLADMLPVAKTVPEIMGIEGAAARSYYRSLARLLPSELGFAERNRRPPLDVVNASLSYGYAVLEGEATSAIAAAGLDPTLGFMHGDDRTRRSLSLDLTEEFRPLIIDHAVAEAFRRRSLAPEHGRRETGRSGVLLTEHGRRRLLTAIENRLLTLSNHPATGHRVSYPRHIHLQAQQIAMCIDLGEWQYQPVAWRS
jgi:CRISPR-associated protein Cas1